MYINHFSLPVEGDKDSFSYEDYNAVLMNESLEFFLFRSQMALLVWTAVGSIRWIFHGRIGGQQRYHSNRIDERIFCNEYCAHVVQQLDSNPRNIWCKKSSRRGGSINTIVDHQFDHDQSTVGTLKVRGALVRSFLCGFIGCMGP